MFIEGADTREVKIEYLVPGQLYIFALSAYTAFEELEPDMFLPLQIPEGGMVDLLTV